MLNGLNIDQSSGIAVSRSFFLKKISEMSLFLLVVTQFWFNYVLLVRLKIRRAALPFYFFGCCCSVIITTETLWSAK